MPLSIGVGIAIQRIINTPDSAGAIINTIGDRVTM